MAPPDQERDDVSAPADGGDEQEADENDDDDDENDDSVAPGSIAETEQTSATTTASREETASRRPPHDKSQTVPHVRGKCGKTKKVKTKYADQDEEDRELAMKLHGSRAAEEKREADAAANAAKSESVEEARARRCAQHQKAQKEGLEAEEVRRLNLEEGVEALNEDESAALTQLAALVGTPLLGYEILDAIPICAPWTALGKYKYKAKMQPGQQKECKAVREILGRWVKDAGDSKKIDQQRRDAERIWPREAELIRGFKEAEVDGVIPVKNISVMMSGGSGADKGKAGGRGGKGGARGGKGSKKK